MDGLKSCFTDAKADICSQSCSQAIPRNHYLTVIVAVLKLLIVAVLKLLIVTVLKLFKVTVFKLFIVTVLKLLIVAQHKKLLLKISTSYFTYFIRNQ